MSDASTLARPAEHMKLAVSSAKDAHYVPGRRHFFQYRDLGVTEATSGKMRAQVDRQHIHHHERAEQNDENPRLRSDHDDCSRIFEAKCCGSRGRIGRA